MIPIKMIKKILKISLVIALFGSTVFAQRNCGTMDYLDHQLQSDPALQQRMNEIEDSFYKSMLNGHRWGWHQIAFLLCPACERKAN